MLCLNLRRGDDRGQYICSSRTDEQKNTSLLKCFCGGNFVQAHNGPVLKVVWAPPEFGDMVVSCSTDGCVTLWEEVAEGKVPVSLSNNIRLGSFVFPWSCKTKERKECK